MARLLCRLLGHDSWYYSEPVTDDFVFGCRRCKDPALVSDRMVELQVVGRPDLVVIDPAFVERVQARLSVL